MLIARASGPPDPVPAAPTQGSGGQSALAGCGDRDRHPWAAEPQTIQVFPPLVGGDGMGSPLSRPPSRLARVSTCGSPSPLPPVSGFCYPAKRSVAYNFVHRSSQGSPGVAAVGNRH
ncbi:hypothetical protein LZ30DRAFT_743160 [Colletotrichum cereale]|nr:hypothetical protein LZ30DRAFT_743160 [Colletotrichum cereale]